VTTVLLVLLAVLVAGVTVAFLLRRRFLLSGLGAVTMWLRPVRSPRWSVGVAWYGGDVLLWYRGVSLAVRPHERFSRAEVQVESRRAAGRDDLALPSDVVVLTIATPEGARELAMDTSTVTGFLSWVESAPPGS
jgi:Protein of unknown function (DUF2550)